MIEVFVYLLDSYIPTDLTKKEVLNAFSENELKPFELVKEIVEDNGIQGIRNVQFYDATFDGDNFLIEYLVDFANGQTTVKIIGSDDPREMLKNYYKKLKITV